MKKFGEIIVKLRIPILIAAVVLLIPSALGYFNTRVNYDILSYLPGEIETMKGQDVLVDEFGTGAFTMVIVEGMEFKDVSKLKAQMEEVDHVKSIIWYDTFADISIPVDLLPDKVKNAFLKDDCTDQRYDCSGNGYKRSVGGGGANLRCAGGAALCYRAGLDHGLLPDTGIFPSEYRNGDCI